MKEQPVKTVDQYGAINWHLSNGDYHREDGPAYNDMRGYKAWWFYGKRHRIDGPALIRPDGKTEYWFMNKPVYEGDFEYQLIKRKEKEMKRRENPFRNGTLSPRPLIIKWLKITKG
jgi:hypothetical protein